MNRERILTHFNSLSKRKQLGMLETLSQPWIEKKAINEVAKDITVILDLRDKSLAAKRKVEQKGPKITPKKKKRK